MASVNKFSRDDEYSLISKANRLFTTELRNHIQKIEAGIRLENFEEFIFVWFKGGAAAQFEPELLDTEELEAMLWLIKDNAGYRYQHVKGGWKVTTNVYYASTTSKGIVRL